MTKREIVVMHCSAFGVRMSLGSVTAFGKAVSAAMAPLAEAIHAKGKASPTVHADATGFGRCGADRMWLGVGATQHAEAFRLLPNRGRNQAHDLRGEDYDGILHCDRGKPYEMIGKTLHQLGHSHILRDIRAMLESRGETGAQGCMLTTVPSTSGNRNAARSAAATRKRSIDLLEWLAQAMTGRAGP